MRLIIGVLGRLANSEQKKAVAEDKERAEQKELTETAWKQRPGADYCARVQNLGFLLGYRHCAWNSRVVSWKKCLFVYFQILWAFNLATSFELLHNQYPFFFFSFQQPVISAHWLNDGKQFMCSHTEGTLTIWSLKSGGKPVETIRPHSECPLWRWEKNPLTGVWWCLVSFAVNEAY